MGDGAALRPPVTPSPLPRGASRLVVASARLTPKGAVWVAAETGNVVNLTSALAMGGSTEEADPVRVKRSRQC